MAGEADSSILIVSTDFGLAEFTLSPENLSANGVPMTLMSGSEYVVLPPDTKEAYVQHKYRVELEDDVRYVGAFALVFTDPDRKVESRTMLNETTEQG